MTTAVQHRRGTTAEHSTFTGLEGEVTIDTTKDTAVIHDGVLAGGYPLAKETLANVNPSSLTAITGAATASDDLFMVYDASTTSMKKITRAELNNAMEADALANVSITGGTINGTTIGGTTAAAGAFTTLSASGALTVSGNTTLGDASTDTVTVNGYMGVGTSPSASQALRIIPSALTGTDQYGVLSALVGSSAATSSIRGVYTAPQTAAASFTVANIYGYNAADATKGAGSTITNLHGIRIDDQTQGTNNYGITSLVSSGTNKWNIYASGTAANYFAGNVGIGTNSPSRPLTINGTTPYIRIERSGVPTWEIRNNIHSTAYGLSIYDVDNAAQRFAANVAELVINEDGNDYDFRVESDTNTHALFVDAGNSRVGVNTATPGAALTVQSSVALTQQLYNPTAGSTTQLQMLGLNGDGNTNTVANLILGNETAANASSYLAIQTREAGGAQTEKVRVTSTGYLRMASGTGGIQFGGDTAAANALDDYEEGTWTPTLSGWNGSYTTQSAKYTKIGRVVTVSGVVETTGGTGTWSNYLGVNSFPFAGIVSTNGTARCGWYEIFSGLSGSMPSNAVSAGPLDGPSNNGTGAFANVWRVGAASANWDYTYLDSSANVLLSFQVTYVANS